MMLIVSSWSLYRTKSYLTRDFALLSNLPTKTPLAIIYELPVDSPRRVIIESMAQVHMTEAEVARNFAAALEKVRQGIEVVVENNHEPVAIIRPPAPPGRSVVDCIALAKAHEEETGEAPTLDPDFAADVEEIIRSRKTWNPPSWD
jgi:antitoxin (DNA-binding transcriptional repressor) of toxin-antitoxin stability system